MGGLLEAGGTGFGWDVVVVPDVEGELENGEDAKEHLEGVQVEGEDAAGDEVGACVVEAGAEAEGRVGTGAAVGRCFCEGGVAEDLVPHFLHAGGVGGFGDDLGGEGVGWGGVVVHLGGEEEGLADAGEAAADAGEDGGAVVGGAGVGEDAADADGIGGRWGRGRGKALVVGGRRLFDGSVHFGLLAAAEGATGGDLLGGAPCDGAEVPGGGIARGLEAEVLANHGVGEILAGGTRLHEGNGGRDGDRVYVEIPAGGVPAEDLGQVFLGARGELDAGPDERGLWVGRGLGGGEDAGHAKTFLGDATEGGAAHRVVRDDVARADRWLQHGGIVVESGLWGTHAVGGG